MSKRTEFSLGMRIEQAGAARDDEIFLARPLSPRRERGQRKSVFAVQQIPSMIVSHSRLMPNLLSIDVMTTYIYTASVEVSWRRGTRFTLFVYTRCVYSVGCTLFWCWSGRHRNAAVEHASLGGEGCL